MYPEDQISTDRWRELFGATGFVANHSGIARPDRPVKVFRACNPADVRRLTWTTDLSVARAHQWQDLRHRIELWRALAPPDAVLAWFDHFLVSAVRGSELVVDPDLLYDLQRLE